MAKADRDSSVAISATGASGGQQTHEHGHFHEPAIQAGTNCSQTPPLAGRRAAGRVATQPKCEYGFSNNLQPVQGTRHNAASGAGGHPIAYRPHWTCSTGPCSLSSDNRPAAHGVSRTRTAALQQSRSPGER